MKTIDRVKNYSRKNAEAINQCINAEKEYFSSFRWLQGVVALFTVFIFSSFVGLVLTRPDIKTELMLLEELRSESISPHTFNVLGGFFIFLSAFVFWNPRSERLVKRVSSSLLLLSFSVTVVMGLLYGEIFFWIAQQGENSMPLEKILLVATLIPFVFFVILAIYLYSLGVTQLILVDTWDRLDKPARHVG
jgi:hypothetical protein